VGYVLVQQTTDEVEKYTTFRWYIVSVICVPKITYIRQLLLKLLLVVV